MITMQHRQWNIRYDALATDEAARMPPDVVASEINRLSRMLAEAEFLLACHGDGMAFPEELRYGRPADDYAEA